MKSLKFDHILLTGNGFELRTPNSLGLPPTRDLLLSMGWPFGKENLRLIQNENGGFPYIKCDSYDKTQELKKSADLRNLEKYWDILIQNEIDRLLPDQAAAMEREYSIRESFQMAVMKHDRGHLPQSLIAASLNWSAWISSSVSRFSDRAVDSINSQLFHKNKEKDYDIENLWKCIRNSKSANALRSALLHRHSSKPKHHYLFKLSGSIDDVSTRALAGLDKEIFSPFIANLDSFNDIYSALNQYLVKRALLSKREGSIQIWHIVGHSLFDSLLNKIIVDCFKILGVENIWFYIISPFPEAASNNLKNLLCRSGADSVDLKLNFFNVNSRIYFNQIRNYWLDVFREKTMIKPDKSPKFLDKDWVLGTIFVENNTNHAANKKKFESSSTENDKNNKIESTKIFISYAREDEKAAKKIYDDLKAAGHKPWIDTKDLKPGERWKSSIKKAIVGSKYFLALISSHSIDKRGFVQSELKIALEILDEFPEDAIFIIPVRLDDCQLQNAKLKELHIIDLFPLYNRGLTRLLDAI